MKIIACDQSFQRPGFAQLEFDETSKAQLVVRISHIDNKSYQATHYKPDSAKRKEVLKKPHGQILAEIAHEFHSYLRDSPDAVLVREEALDLVRQNNFGGMKASNTIKVLHKVIGVTDLYAWANDHKVFHELHPFTVKKRLTDNHLATKEDLAKVLPFYVGNHTYACDDESDAVAVGVAWLIDSGYLAPVPLPEGFLPAPEPKKTKTKKSKKDSD